MPQRPDIGGDAAVVEEMAEMVVRHKIDRNRAQRYAFMWLTIFAAFEGTNISGVLDNFTKAAPSRSDQNRLIERLKHRVSDTGGIELGRRRVLH